MVLNKDKLQGLAVPDLKKYYNAILLSRVMEWARIKNEKRWVKLENTISNAPLSKMIWIPPQYREKDENTHEMTQNIFIIWDSIHTKE